MATKLETTQTFSVDARTVRAMQSDPAYIAFRAERTGAVSVTSTVTPDPTGGVTIDIERVFPAQVPSFAKSFIGETITVTEQYAWGPVADDGSSRATMTASFSAPMSLTGTVTMDSDGSTTTLRTSAELKASVPFVGGKVEDLAKEQFLRYLRAEEKLAVAWLAGER